MELRNSRFFKGWGSQSPCKQTLRLLLKIFYLSSSYIVGMPEIFSFTSGKASKIIPKMTIVEAEEHDSQFFFEKSKTSKQANKTIRQYCSRGFCVGMVFSRNFVHRLNLEEHVPSLEGEGLNCTFLMLHNALIENITEFYCF